MSQESRLQVKELYRDRYARTGEASYRLKKILLPCHGIGIRSKQDLKTLINLRLTYETDHLGLCITQLAYSDNTLVDLSKELEEQKHKFKFTARGEQLKMFTDKTLLAVEPQTESTYWEHQKTFEKIQKSLETPKFLKEYVEKVLKKRKELGADSEKYHEWKDKFFEDSWNNVVSDKDLLDDLALENHSGQITCGADWLIPPTNPVISTQTFDIATKIIEHSTRIWGDSTALYLVLQKSVIKNDDLRAKILQYYATSKLPILMLKIKDFEPLEPDRVDLRNAFSEIQEKFCEIRKMNNKKCTILLEGGKLTYPSLVRGFDIVTNNFSGRNILGGGRRKKGTIPSAFSQYYIHDKKIFYQFEKMQEFARNELRLTNNQHALNCPLPCCKDVKTLEGVTRTIWNYSITRPHFALWMNKDAKYVSDLIYKNQIQKAKDPLLKSELCVLKNLIPDV